MYHGIVLETLNLGQSELFVLVFQRFNGACAVCVSVFHHLLCLKGARSMSVLCTAASSTPLTQNGELRRGSTDWTTDWTSIGLRPSLVKLCRCFLVQLCLVLCSLLVFVDLWCSSECVSCRVSRWEM